MPSPVGAKENAEFVAVAMLLQRWDDIAPWLVEELFADDTHRRAFLALAGADGNLTAAIEQADLFERAESLREQSGALRGEARQRIEGGPSPPAAGEIPLSDPPRQ